MKTVTLPSGEAVPALAKAPGRCRRPQAGAPRRSPACARPRSRPHPHRHRRDVWRGAAEELIAEAIAGRRDEAFLVRQGLSHNARARARSPLRAQPERASGRPLDLYLLHWRGSIPLAETVEAFAAPRTPARSATTASATSTPATCRSCGAWRVARPLPPTRCSTTWSAATPSRRCCPGGRQRRVPLMASRRSSSPGWRGNAEARGVRRPHGLTPTQAALAWLLGQGRRHRDPQDRPPRSPEGEQDRPSNGRSMRPNWRSSIVSFRAQGPADLER